MSWAVDTRVAAHSHKLTNCRVLARLLVSDGVHYQKVMLKQALNPIIGQGDVQEFSVIELGEVFYGNTHSGNPPEETACILLMSFKPISHQSTILANPVLGRRIKRFRPKSAEKPEREAWQESHQPAAFKRATQQKIDGMVLLLDERRQQMSRRRHIIPLDD